MPPKFSSPSVSGASKVVWGLIWCIFWSGGNATSAGLDADPGVQPPPSLEIPTAPEGSTPLALSIDTPQGIQTTFVVIRDDAGDEEVSFRV